MRRWSVGFATAVLLGSGICRAADASEQWVATALESFEMYCFRTSAKYGQIQSMATAMKLRPMPEEYVLPMMGPKSTEGKGYFVEWDKRIGVFILLGFSKPDACSINVQGLSYESVRDKLLSTYKLVPAFRDDVGLQVSEVYVPGGKTGKKNEARELGLVSLTYPKPHASPDGFTLSYTPPETVLMRLPQ